MTNKWKVVKLDDATDYINRGVSPVYTEDNSGTAVVNQKCIRNGQVNFNLARLTDESIKLVPQNKLVQSFDILINSTGTGTVGRVGQIEEIDKKITTDSHVTIVRPNKEVVDPIFFGQQIKFKEKYIESLASGSTNQVELSREKIANIDVVVPPMKSQQKIALILSSIDETIQKTNRVIEKTSKLKNGLLDELLTKGVGHTKFKKTKVGEIPEEWNVCNFLDVAELQRGFDLPSQKRTKGVFPLISSNGVTDSNNEYKVSGPGVITGRSGTIGKVFYTEENFWPLNTTLYIKNFNGNFPKYIYYLLVSIDLKKFLTGTGVPTLNRNIVHDVNVAFPNSLEEQKKISDILDQIDKKVELAKIEKDKLNNLKMGLMHDIFSQKVEIN